MPGVGRGGCPHRTGGVKFPGGRAKPTLPPKPGHCSAFAATGPATGDGKIVFGHITMFGLYPSTFYNLWLDVQPKEGHRVLMQSFPGGIHSGMDYYLNSAGILVLETTLDQTRFNVAGVPLASRIRRAVQYSDTIDEVVETLKSANNGLYTNEWLLADVKTNEIAMFELGTASSKLYRSSKGEWFGGTEGFYWGCNNAKDMAVRLETIAGTNDRPFNAVWEPSIRDQKWIELYAKYKGKIGEAFGKEAFTTPPICALRRLMRSSRRRRWPGISKPGRFSVLLAARPGGRRSTNGAIFPRLNRWSATPGRSCTAKRRRSRMERSPPSI